LILGDFAENELTRRASSAWFVGEIMGLLQEDTSTARKITVSFGDSTPDLGPLPISDDNAALQRESIKALNALLKGRDDIIFRNERVDDYGVDGSFELKLQSRARSALLPCASVCVTDLTMSPEVRRSML
jgi:hypothetical protein